MLPGLADSTRRAPVQACGHRGQAGNARPPRKRCQQLRPLNVGLPGRVRESAVPAYAFDDVVDLPASRTYPPRVRSRNIWQRRRSARLICTMAAAPDPCRLQTSAPSSWRTVNGYAGSQILRRAPASVIARIRVHSGEGKAVDRCVRLARPIWRDLTFSFVSIGTKGALGMPVIVRGSTSSTPRTRASVTFSSHARTTRRACTGVHLLSCTTAFSMLAWSVLPCNARRKTGPATR